MKVIVLTLLLCFTASVSYAGFGVSSFSSGTFGISKATTKTTKFGK